MAKTLKSDQVKNKKKADEANTAPQPTSIAGPDDDKWKVERGFQTLMDAEDLKQDKELMKKIHKHAKTQKKKIKSVQDIVDFKNEKYGYKTDDQDMME